MVEWCNSTEKADPNLFSPLHSANADLIFLKNSIPLSVWMSSSISSVHLCVITRWLIWMRVPLVLKARLSRSRVELQPWLTLLLDAWLSINEDKQNNADGIQMSGRGDQQASRNDNAVYIINHVAKWIPHTRAQATLSLKLILIRKWSPEEMKTKCFALRDVSVFQSWSHAWLGQRIINLHFSTLEFVVMVPSESFLSPSSKKKRRKKKVASRTDGSKSNGKIMTNK